MLHSAVRGVVVLCGALLVSATVQAQSINVDVDNNSGLPSLGSGPPSSAYGAASGQVGFWNAFAAQNVGTPFGLSDLSGSALPVTITRTVAFGSGGVLGFNNSTNSGDYRLLMNDAAQVGTTTQGGTDEYIFNNLLAGRYQVWTYGAPPTGNPGFTPVDVLGSSDPVQILTGGANNNTFTLGGTHAIHNVQVTTGTLTIRIDIPSNPGAPGYINGFQIVAVPTPGGLLMLGITALVGTRRRRR